MRILLIALFGVILSSIAQSDWSYSHKIDDFTDSNIHMAMVAGDETTADWKGKGMFIVRCIGEEVDAYVDMDTYIGNKSSKVRYRIDKNEATPYQTWNISTKGTTVFSRQPELLAAELTTGNSILVEVLDYQNTPSKKSFSLLNSKVTINKVLSACARTKENNKKLAAVKKAEKNIILDETLKNPSEKIQKCLSLGFSRDFCAETKGEQF